MADASLATEVGRQVFPDEEAEVISTLVERDSPYYRASVSHEAVDGLNRFCLARNLMSKPVEYAQLIATSVQKYWER